MSRLIDATAGAAKGGTVMEQKDYIERDAALNIAFEWCPDDDGSVGKTGDLRDILDELEAIPAADVRPVVRGRWEVGGMFDDIGRCSCCHYMFPLDTAMTEFHYCPNCGADMREEET